jgi:hypothetical protein
MAIMACSNENYGIKYKQNLKIYLGPFRRDGSAVEEFLPACRQAGTTPLVGAYCNTPLHGQEVRVKKREMA